MMVNRLFCALLCLSALSVSTPAFCQEEDDDRARQLYEEGTRLYDLGKYEESVAAFDLAYGLSKRPQLLYNKASALERLARWQEALEALQQYRRDAKPKAEELVSLTVRIDQLQARIDARDAQEAIDHPPPPDPIAPEPEPEGLPVGALALYGGGAVALGAGTFFSLKASKARKDWQSQCVDGSLLLCSDEAQASWKRDNGNSLAADLSWLVGLGSIAGGVVVTLASSDSADVQLSVAPQPWLGGGSVGLGGRF